MFSSEGGHDMTTEHGDEEEDPRLEDRGSEDRGLLNNLGDWLKLFGGLGVLVSLLIATAVISSWFQGLRSDVDDVREEVDDLMESVGLVNKDVGDLAGPRGSVETGLTAATEQHDSIEEKVDDKVNEVLGVVSLSQAGLLGRAGIIGARRGEATWCGQFYDPEQIVGAVPDSKLPDWPCGTTLTVVTVGAVDEEGLYLGIKVKVVDKFPDVKTNDPFLDRIIQLSPEAAGAIGLSLETGITRVFVTESGGEEESSTGN
jgi:hypothetical protein